MAIKVSKNRQNTYATYKAVNRWKTNRERKLQRALKRNPNNLQIAQALKNISYRRHTPKAAFWTHSMKRTAEVIKEYCGSCPHAIFSSNHITAATTLSSLGRGKVKADEKFNKQVDFSIKGRAKYGSL